MSLHIRTATADDAALILRFITDLAIYEKAEHEVQTDVAGIRDSLFGAGSTTHALICEQDGVAIGYAQAGPCGLPHPDVQACDGELKRLYLLLPKPQRRLQPQKSRQKRSRRCWTRSPRGCFS